MITMKMYTKPFWNLESSKNTVTKSSAIGKSVEIRHQYRGQIRFWTSKLGKWKTMFEFNFFRAVRGSFLLATSVCTYSGTFWKANPVRENGLFIVFSCIYRNLPSKFPKSSLTSILVSDFHPLLDLGGLCNRVFWAFQVSKRFSINFHHDHKIKSR